MYIYRLFINNTTIYIGETGNIKKKYIAHKSDCYNKNSKKYNYRLYVVIRQLYITQEMFYDVVKYEFLYNVPNKCSAVMDDLVMEFYSSHCNLLNNQRGNVFNVNDSIEDNQQYIRQYYQDNKDIINEKIECEHGSFFVGRNLQRHIISVKHQSYVRNI
jgi:hypothetical protein